MQEYTLKLIVRESDEKYNARQELTADLVITARGEVIKDRIGLIQKAVWTEARKSREDEKRKFIQSTAALCLAGMMANPARDEDDGLNGGTFLGYGDPDYGAKRAVGMAKALWNHLPD